MPMHRFILLLLSSCVSYQASLRDEAKSVKVVFFEDSNSIVEKCNNLNTVVGFAEGFGNSEEYALNDLMNKAFDLNATHVVINRRTGSDNDSLIIGIAYNCPL